MRVRCPNCSHPIEMVDDRAFEDLSCPSCGSRIRLSGSDEDTVTSMVAGRVPALQFFELLEPIGAGQFGRVWRARDTELDRIVAVKLPHRQILTAEEAGFIVREARSAAQLQHPNIVTVFEVGRHDDMVYIVSEYIEGVPLSEWRRHYHPDVRESAQLCAVIARALQHAHDNKVVHRDLKPGNIVMDAQRQPHITDFGLAKREGADVTIAATGQILGTPAYMAPEQIRDGHSADRRSDVYALGVILYELIASQRPFTGGKRVLLQQVQHDDPKSPRSIDKNISKDLETICLKALAKKPDERFQTTQEMAEELERYLRGEPILTRRVSPITRAVRWAQRRPAQAATIVLTAIVVALLLALTFRPPLESGGSPNARQVLITTLPPAAHVRLIPLNDRTGMPEPDRATDVGASPVTATCEPGNYLVVAYTDNQMFHEVYRHVPANHEKLPGIYPHLAWKKNGDAIDWTPIQLFATQEVTSDMVFVTGGTFVLPTTDLAGETEVKVPDFYLDETETTFGQLAKAKLNLPIQMRDAAPAAELPVHNVDWNEAAYYAEMLGKRLIREESFQFVVTQGGTNETADAWQTVDDNVPGPVTNENFDRIEWSSLSKPVIGMRSNVLEWTANWFAGAGVGMEMRVVRGGYSFLDATLDTTSDRTKPPPRQVKFVVEADPRLGFRCIRSARPSLAKEDLVQLRVLEE